MGFVHLQKVGYSLLTCTLGQPLLQGLCSAASSEEMPGHTKHNSSACFYTSAQVALFDMFRSVKLCKFN